MTTYNCPRCGHPSTAERCGFCGRGPEPLLARLGELDSVLASMPATLQSRAAVEAERRGVLEQLTETAARHHAEARNRAHAADRPAPPQAAPGAAPQSQAAPAPLPQSQAAAPGTPPHGPVPPTPAAQPVQMAPGAAPRPPHTPPSGAPPVRHPAPRPERGEVGSKTVQTVLLSLGGLLVAAAIIIFTAVAWRNLGNGGRAAILGGATLLLLAVPFACKRFKLWATAETFAALGALALWCTTLAGYYLYRPAGADFGPETVGAWTAAVLAVLAVYRAAAKLSAVSWALPPLALVGASYAAASPLGLAVTLMLAMALALGAAAWITGNRPGHFTRSDTWASRFLTCAAIVAACSAGLRAAFGLDGPVVPPVAAAVAMLAAANLAGVHFTRRLGASLTTVLVAASAAGSLVLAAWVLAIRSDAGELAVPSIALFAAALLPFLFTNARRSRWPLTAALVAGLASLAAFAAVAFDAPDLSAYFVAFLAARLIAPFAADPLGKALRHAAYLVGVGTAAVAGVVATLGGVVVLLQPGLGWSIDLEVPIVLAAFAVAAVLLPRRFRVNAATLAVSLAVAAAAVRLWSEDPARYDAVPTLGFIACGVIALISAIASGTVAGRCTGWASLAVWTSITAGAAAESETMRPGEGWIPFWVTVTAAGMLVVAMGAPRRSRPDRVLAAVLAHVLAGASVFAGLVNWIAWSLEGSGTELFPAAQLGVYTLALVGAAMMAPFRKWGYAIAALCTGTLGWWALLAAQDVTTVELFTAPPAAVLFLIGLWRLERRPQTGSWAALALPVLLGIGPSLLMALGEGEPARRVGVGAAAIAVILAGLYRRWQAPLVLGSVALAVVTVNELSLLWHLIPVWIPPAIGGAVLILAGATFEKRRRDLARIRDGLKTMR
ncbi:hypothetical protein LO763_09455 [Glycomyces sp. A-F 0318]|uniref:SCO7613 C-terminal domain-containing membrane protein n=1 Tax=Glycomyces amatae TaxID=2881355 RepID=UPI001E2FE512|nr:hypothetical protein [Glycomyces amatae]MCD0443849.1 hypothetical protein [Glycomyces amatae]